MRSQYGKISESNLVTSMYYRFINYYYAKKLSKVS